MKMNKNYIFRQIADEYLLIPVGEAALHVKGLVSLSESGYLMYQQLLEGCTRDELLAALLREYEIDPATAEQDVDAFLDKMRTLDMLEEDTK